MAILIIKIVSSYSSNVGNVLGDCVQFNQINCITSTALRSDLSSDHTLSLDHTYLLTNLDFEVKLEQRKIFHFCLEFFSTFAIHKTAQSLLDSFEVLSILFEYRTCFKHYREQIFMKVIVKTFQTCRFESSVAYSMISVHSSVVHGSLNQNIDPLSQKITSI